MIRKLPAILTGAAALLGSSLLAQDNPRPDQPRPEQPRGENPGGERNVRERGPRRPEGEQRDPGQRPPEGERPRPQRGPDGERPPGDSADRQPSGRERQPERPMKPTPYVGLVTSRVPSVLAAQIGLGEGFGLVVDDVLPDSPAKTAGLQQHDVLKLLNDQRLTDPNQLAALIRSFGKDTEISLTILRKSQEQKISVKIGEKQLPEPRAVFGDLQRKLGSFGLQFPDVEGGGLRDRMPGGQGPMQDQPRRFQERMRAFQQEMQRYQERLRDWQKKPAGEMPAPPPIPELEPPPGPGADDRPRDARPGGDDQIRRPQPDGSATVRSSAGRMVMKDNDGEIEVTMRDGQRTLVAKNAAGETVFTGPVGTPEQRAAVPEPFRAKLGAIEARQRDFNERSPVPGNRPAAGREVQ